MNSPRNFLPAPGGFRPPQAQPARVVQVPPAPPTATLSVRAPNRVTLSKALLAAVPHLKAGAPVELVPPPRRGGTWHLDTRPTATRRLPKARAARAEFATAHRLNPEHFLAPVCRAVPGVAGGTGGVARLERRTFALGPEVPGHPGYYALLPLD